MIVSQQDMSQRWRLHQKGAGRIVELSRPSHPGLIE